MQKDQRRALVGACFALATIVFTTTARSQDYIYTAGPNTVNVSGARCRTAVAAEQVNLSYTNNGVRVSSGTKTLYCPVPRRSTAFYADSVADNASVPIATTLTITSVVIRAVDSNPFARLSCRPFAALLGGGYAFGATRNLCGTAGGCPFVPSNSWTGTNTITWTNPFPTQETVNWGISCSVPGSSGIDHYEVVVTPNV